MDSVRKAMVLDCSQMIASGFLINYPNFGYFQYIVSQLHQSSIIRMYNHLECSGCAGSSPCCHCQAWCSPAHHLEGIYLLHPDLSHCCWISSTRLQTSSGCSMLKTALICLINPVLANISPLHIIDGVFCKYLGSLCAI